MDQAGLAQRLDVAFGPAQLTAGRGGVSGHGAGVAERAGRLQVHEVGHAEQRRVELLPVQPDTERGLGPDDRVPRLSGVEVTENVLGVAAEQAHERRIELGAGPPAGQRHRAAGPADPVGDLHVLRQLREPRGDRHGVPPELAGPAPAVPLLIGGSDGLLHRDGQSELRRQGPGQRRVLLDHPVQLAEPGQRELQAHPETVQRRVALADPAQGRGRRGDAPGLVLVFERLDPDVVTEPLRLLVSIGMTAHVDQQRRVVDDRPRLVVQPGPLRQAQRDQALAQHVFHGLAEAEVDAERQGRDELGQAHRRTGGRRGRAVEVRQAPSLQPDESRAQAQVLDT